WLYRRAAHWGPEPAAPSARPLPRPRRRSVARWGALGLLPTGLLLAGAGAVPPVPPPVPGEAAGRLRRRQAGVLRDARPAGRRRRLRPLPGRVAAHRMGRLCQAALRRPGGRPGLSPPLHTPRRDRQQAA